MNRSGYDCMVGDITDLDLPANCVKFVKMAHILEHLPGLKDVGKTLDTARKTATDFIVITGPFFDEDAYLKSKGFKLYWSDYPEHTCHLKVSELIKILDSQKFDNYQIFLRFPILGSDDNHIQLLSAPRGAHHYDPAKHPPKKKIVFDRLIWTDFVCYIQLRPLPNWPATIKAFEHQIPYVEVKDGVKYQWPERTLRQFIELDLDSQAKDRTIDELKAQRRQLADKVKDSQAHITRLKNQLAGITNAKAWKAARIAQKAAAAVKKPSLIRAKLRAKKEKNYKS